MYLKTIAAVLTAAAFSVSSVATAQTASAAFLGIYGEDPQLAAQREGSYVREVITGGPGQKGGLRPGDVIVRADNKDIRSFDDLVATIKGSKPGDVINFGVQRDGQTQNVVVTLGSSAEDPSKLPGAQPGPTNSRRPMLGLVTQPLDEGLRTRLNVGERRGVLVAETEPEGPAAKGGVESGDVVLSVDDQPTSHPTIFSDVILTKKPGDVIVLKLVRAGKEIEKKVTLGSAPTGMSGRLLEGPLGVIRSHQVEEMRLRIKELEGQVKDLTDKLERATTSGKATTTAKPVQKPTPTPTVPGTLTPPPKPQPLESKKSAG